MAKKHALTHMIYAVLVMTIIMVIIRCNQDFVASIFTKDQQDVIYI